MLTSGQIALGISQDGLLPSFFGRQNRFGAPSVAILISCVGIVPILFLTLNENLAQQVNVIIDISVTAFLFVYVMCCLAYLKLLLKEPAQARKRDWLVGILALSFCGWVIAATSIKVLTIASLFVLSGLPIYLIRHQKKMKPSLNMTSA
jgi:APA family basic amino acid/polyamine antiporter